MFHTIGGAREKQEEKGVTEKRKTGWLIAILGGLTLLLGPAPARAVQAAGPSPDAKETVIFLAKGPRGAPVTIIEFSDFQCPFCAKAVPVIHKLLSALQ